MRTDEGGRERACQGACEKAREGARTGRRKGARGGRRDGAREPHFIPMHATAPSLFVYSSNAFAIVSSSSTHDATCPANGHAVCLNLLG